MSDNKELKIGVKIDSSGFQEIERKIKDLNALAEQATSRARVAQRMQSGEGGPDMSPTSRDAFERADKQRRQEVRAAILEQIKQNDTLKTHYEKQLETQKKITEEIKKQKEGSAEHLKLQEQLHASQKNADQLHKTYMDNQAKIQKTLDATEPEKGAVAKAFAEKGGVRAVVGAAVGAAITAIPTIIRQEGTKHLLTAESAGAGIRGTLGREVSALSTGEINQEMAWLPEKAKAYQDALDAKKARQTADKASPWTTIGGWTAGGAIAGSAIPGLGTIAGGVGGLITGLGIVGYNMLTDQRYRSAQLAPLSDSHKKNYEAIQAKEFAEDFTKSLTAQQDMDPAKSVAVDYLSKFGRRDLAAQRKMGLSDNAFYGRGGYLQRGTQAGFTSESTLGMSNEILGAGGSTRVASESILALQASRNFDLTNAGAVMGRISGSAGTTSASEAIFKKVLEAGVKAGLDGSEFREEQRKFADITSSILQQSGVTTASDAQSVLAGFNRFLGDDRTMKGMEGAKSAYEEYQQFTSETGGRGGSMQFAQFMKNPLLSKLDPGQMAALMEIPDGQLTSTNPRIAAYAHSLGVSPDALMKELEKEKFAAVAHFSDLDPTKQGELGKYMTENAMDPANMTSGDLDQLKKDRPDLYRRYQETVTKQSMRGTYENQQKVAGGIRGLIPGLGYEPSQETAEETVAGGFAKGADTGRVGDRAESNAAVAAQAMINNFNGFKDAIVPATKAVNEFAEKLIVFANAMANASKEDKEKMGIAIQKDLTNYMLQQQQAGKPKK